MILGKVHCVLVRSRLQRTELMVDTTYAKALKEERYHYRFLLSGAGVQASVPNGHASMPVAGQLRPEHAK